MVLCHLIVGKVEKPLGPWALKFTYSQANSMGLGPLAARAQWSLQQPGRN